MRLNLGTKKLGICVLAGAAAGSLGLRLAASEDQPAVQHAECTIFGAGRERFARQARNRYLLSAVTGQVTRALAPLPAHAAKFAPASKAGQPANLIDRYIFPALEQAGVAPAPTTSDFEFARRVSLDLAGRVPAPEVLLAFVNDANPDKRARFVDALLGSAQWADKWTMYFGDHFKNAARKQQVVLFPAGRNAFYQWIHDSIKSNKPYDQMAREIIAARGTNSYDPAQAAINWLVGGRVTGGPPQDIWDQQTANVAETFLGISHLNCLLCHNGRGHLDQLSLWGKETTRYQAWQLASFLSHTSLTVTRMDPTQPQPYYWAIEDNVRFRADYPLNTTTGNRPARQPARSERNVAPVYLFSGKSPARGENYRDVLAREVTADFQFARASANYIWKEFFGRGIVEPADQFDPARLDPDNPPPAPWTLQPSNPALLNALAQDFIDSGYDLKHLMRLIATSETYQLSSRYEGEWNPAWEPLFARKLVRRLWGEEIMDALSQTSGVLPSYAIGDNQIINWAMQAPEPLAISARAGGAFLSNFLPGNRDDQERRSDGAVQQALALMNDPFVMQRTRASSSSTGPSLLARALQDTNDALVDRLYLTVLSRYPSEAEKSEALANLQSGNRSQKASDLLWSLYNRVDFIYNY
jgi:hypothetical protein